MENSSISLVCILLLPLLFSQSSAVGETGSISVLITEKGLDFVRELAVEQAVGSLVPLRLRDLEKSLKVPFIGGVYAKLSNITLHQIDVSSSVIKPGSSGITIVASDAKAKISMDWFYSYSTWYFPIDFSDRGTASVQVTLSLSLSTSERGSSKTRDIVIGRENSGDKEIGRVRESGFVRSHTFSLYQVDGLEVGLTVGMENEGGTLMLSVIEAGCSMENISIVLEGGASWLYQGILDAFGEQFRASLETTIRKKLTEGISKVDFLMQNLPKKVKVDQVTSMNVTFVNQPILKSSSVELDINGLFLGNNDNDNNNKIEVLNANLADNTLCDDQSPMLGISLKEDVFTSASLSYFHGGQMHWMVDKAFDQSLLNTAGWRFIIPQLYKKYPNENMKLNFTLTAPPILKISRSGFDAKILSDMTVDVIDVKGDISVACISVDISGSGVAEVFGNNIGGRMAMNDFSLHLKWSNIGNFHMSLIQGVIRVFLDNVVVPYVNSRLKVGFPLPLIHGFTLKNATLLSSDSRVDVCADVVFVSSRGGNRPFVSFL